MLQTAVQDSQEAEAGVQGQVGYMMRLSRQLGIFCCLFPSFLSFSEVGSFEWLLKIFLKRHSVKMMASGTNLF